MNNALTNLPAEKFYEKMQNYIDTIADNKIFVELTKCCGYSEFMLFQREHTLGDVYKMVRSQFHIPNSIHIDLYVLGTFQERIVLPISETIKIHEYIHAYLPRFTPIYAMPAKAVFRLYLDDGHCTSHRDVANANNTVNMTDACISASSNACISASSNACNTHV